MEDERTEKIKVDSFWGEKKEWITCRREIQREVVGGRSVTG